MSWQNSANKFSYTLQLGINVLECRRAREKYSKLIVVVDDFKRAGEKKKKTGFKFYSDLKKIVNFTFHHNPYIKFTF